MALARIGRFHIERRLGSGSFATVWLAWDEDLDAWVAIKILADNWSYNEDARRRFLEEARALRQLDNDRIVRVYEVGRLEDDRPYMVMELADRGTLEDRIRLRRNLGRAFSVREALDVSVEIAECIASVHASRIVHRDIKPSNVLFRSVAAEAQEALRRLGRPVVSERTLLGDFGIARRLEGMLGHTLVLGSPQYMAPEQADAERAGAADERSDIYSAAVVLYELLAGRLPHRIGTIGDLERLGEQPPPPIERFRPSLPLELSRAIHRGLAFDPARRVSSAWEWRDALTAALARVPDAEPAAVPAVAPSPVAAQAARGDRVATSADARDAPGTTVPAPTRTGTGRLEDAEGGHGPGKDPARPDRTDAMRGPSPVRGDRAAAALPAGGPAGGIIDRPPVRLGLPAFGALAAAVLAVTGVFLPWDRGARGSSFGQSGTVAVAAVLLFLCGLRLWRTQRRWVAILAGSLALGVGAAGVLYAPATMLAIGGSGSGLVVVFVAAAISFGSGYLALQRLGRDPRVWKTARTA